MRATVVRTDGSGQARIADELADENDAWTQFAGWSPDGKQAIVSRGWQDAENANWEQEMARRSGIAEVAKAFGEFDCNVPKLLASSSTEIPARWLPNSSQLRH